MRLNFEKPFFLHLKFADFAIAMMILFSLASCNDLTSKGAKFSGKETDFQTNSSLVLKPRDYVNWIRNEENGLKKSKIIDDIEFTAQFKPLPYVVCMEQQTDEVMDSLLKKDLNELMDLEYFELTLKIKDGQGELLKYGLLSSKEYNDRVNYFAFKMQDNIFLKDGLDTIQCALYHFERSYDVSPESKFLLGFKKPKIGNVFQTKSLQFADNVFHKGIIKFEFNESDLKNIPTLYTIQ